MKRYLILGLMVAALAAAGCSSKEKTCRCSVRGNDATRNSDVRIIKIEKGECDQLHVLNFHTSLDTLKTDTLYCTDYEFGIDSIYKQ